MGGHRRRTVNAQISKPLKVSFIEYMYTTYLRVAIAVTLKNKPANGLSCLDLLVFPKVIVKIKTSNKNKAICHLAVPDVDSSVIGEKPLSGSGKRLFSPRICANSLNLKVQKHWVYALCTRKWSHSKKG